MTTALDARPRLRADLKIVRREHQGRVQYVVKLPDEGKYYQFGETEIELMRFMDGESSPAEIASRAGAALASGERFVQDRAAGEELPRAPASCGCGTQCGEAT